MSLDHGASADADRAGGLRPEPPSASQPVGAHPSRRWWVSPLLAGILASAFTAGWGHYQFERGFRIGVDTSLCAWRVGFETDGAVIPRTLRECRDRDASLAEDAQRLSPEGVPARAEGIAQNSQPASDPTYD